MARRLALEDVQPGQIYDATFWPNPVEGSEYRFRATHLGAARAPKVVLCDDTRIHPGARAQVRVVRIDKPNRSDRGFIEVEFVQSASLELDGIYLDPEVSKKLQVLLESGLNILLDGPQGSGKTTTVRAVARALGMEFVFFNCAAVMEPTDFVATLQIRASETGTPITEFLPTELMRAIEAATARPRRRYLVFLDELNRAPESARNVLMPALDSTRRLFDPVSNTFVAIPDNVQFVAAVNRGSAFSATFGIDAAQLDRFAPLQMDYLPADEEVKLLVSRHPEVPRRWVRHIVAVAAKVRSSPDIDRGLSVRATEEVCVYLSHPLLNGTIPADMGHVLKSSFCGRFDGRWDDPATDAGVVWRIVRETLDSIDLSADEG